MPSPLGPKGHILRAKYVLERRTHNNNTPPRIELKIENNINRKVARIGARELE